jgi:8-oxo-dGTP diphosphatase
LWISNAGEMGVDAYLGALEESLGRGAAIVQIREKEFAPRSLRRFAEELMLRCRRFGVRVVVNDDAALAMAIGAAGVHLPARRLAQLPHRPDLPLVGASAHSREEIERAAALGCDYCVLGPVKPTPSHPGAPGLGWERFADMVVDAPVPVFALGGLDPGDLARAQAAGAHGIAMQRGLTAALPAAGIAAATAVAKLA